MKLKTFSVLFLLFVFIVNASNLYARTIHVETAGTLPDLIPESEKYSIEELTITGELNGTDFRLLRDMAGNNYLGEETEGKLTILDISSAKIVPGGEKYVDTYHLFGWSGNFSFSLDNADELPRSVFHGCKLVSISLPTSLKSIDYYAFYGCNLTSITIPTTVMSIKNAFSGCSNLTAIKVENGNTVYDSRNDCNAIIKTATNTLITGCKNTTIPNTVTSIGGSAFEKCSGLTSITIPNTVKHIGNSAFRDCDALTFINIPDGVTSIGNSVFSGCSSLTSIVIPNTVTSIEGSAFSDCSSLTSITIPDAVTSIGEYAFHGCSNLTSFTIPEGVTNIKESTFWGCSGLTSITIPDGVTSIGGYAFNGCSGLITFTIPDAVTSIGKRAFSGCSGLTSITIPKTMTTIEEATFEGCSGLTSFTIPDAVTSIGNSAFSGCSGLTSITIPKTVMNIGGYAFYNCKSLTSIEVPNTVTSIQNKVFEGCSSLTSITIPNTITSIGNSAFQLCKSLTSITIPNTVTSIGDHAFYYCSSLTSISIPNTLTSIEDGTFQMCISLTTITIPKNVMSIGDGAFWGCGFISVISEIINPFEIKENVFSSDIYQNATLTIPDGTKAQYLSTNHWNKFTTIIDTETSTNRTVHVATAGTLTNIIPDSEKYFIEELTITGELNGTDFRLLRDMAGNDYLGNPTKGKLNKLDISGARIVEGGEKYIDTKKIRFSDGNSIGAGSLDIQTDIIGKFLFVGCSSLTNIILPNNTESISEYAFYCCRDLTAITIPNSVKSIGSCAFFECSGLTSLIIPKSVTSIYCGALSSSFYGCSGLAFIKVESGNNKYDSRDDCNAIIETATNTLITGCKNTIIPSSVMAIGDAAFGGCQDLTSIIIPNSVTTIYPYAFNECSSLTSITIPNSVTNICRVYGLYNAGPAFKGCTSLVSINVDSGNPNYDSRNDCNAIIDTSSNTLMVGCKKTIIPNSVTSIGSYAFSDCTELTAIDIPNSVMRIEDYAFQYCSGLTAIIIPNSVKILGKSAFSGCSNLISITLSNSINSIETATFKDCRNLPSIVIPDEVTTISFMAFDGCSNLSSVNIPNKVTTIISYAFCGCKFSSIIIPNSVKKIGDYAFYCSNLKEITSEIINPFEISDKVFYVKSDATLTVPKGTKSAYQSTKYWNEFTNIVESDKMPDPVIITAKDYTREYGEENPIFDYTASESIEGKPKITCSATKTSPVGTYPIKIEQGSITDENVSYVEGTLTITPAPLTIMAGNYTKQQGEDNPAFKPTYNGFKNGETEDVLTKKPTITCEATKDSEPGSYVIEISGAEAQNYDITYINGTLTVTDAIPVIITAKSYTREYGEKNPYFEYAVSGAVLEGEPVISCEADEKSPVGTYDIIISKGSVTNSNDTYINGTLTITEAPLTITAKSYTIKQGDDLPTFEALYDGFKNNETSNVLTAQPTFSCSATSTSVPGTYDIIVSDAMATNYDISYINGTLIVTPATYTLTYYVDGEVYKTVEYEYGETIIPEAEPTKEGYTFSGWSEIPATMPANDVTVTGTFTVNSYKLTYMIDDDVYKEVMYEYGATITPEPQPDGNYVSFEWIGLPETMPANDVTVYASYETGIINVLMPQGVKAIYAPNGKKLDKLQKGVNIILMIDGKRKKVMVK